MIRKLTGSAIVLASALAASGCVSDYAYRSGDGGYYYSQPGVVYDDYGYGAPYGGYGGYGGYYGSYAYPYGYGNTYIYPGYYGYYGYYDDRGHGHRPPRPQYPGSNVRPPIGTRPLAPIGGVNPGASSPSGRPAIGTRPLAPIGGVGPGVSSPSGRPAIGTRPLAPSRPLVTPGGAAGSAASSRPMRPPQMMNNYTGDGPAQLSPIREARDMPRAQSRPMREAPMRAPMERAPIQSAPLRQAPAMREMAPQRIERSGHERTRTMER